MTWAVDQKCGSAAAKLVLLMLANYCNGHTGQCNPSHKRLAGECDMSVDTLKTHLKKLESLGLIDIIPQHLDSVQLPNQYRVKVGGGGGKNSGEGGGEITPEGGVKNSPPNNQEVKPGTEPEEKARKRATPSLSCPDDVAEQTWNDWLQLRKGKRAAVTETVVAEARKQADKAHVSLDRFLSIWCARGSQGLEADWLKPNERGGPQPSGETPYQRQMRERVAEFAPSIARRAPGEARPLSFIEEIQDVPAITRR